MKRRLLTKTLLASLAVAPLATAPTTVANAQSVVKPSGEIVLSIGRGELVNVPEPMADIFIANEAIADVQIKSQNQLYVMGRSGGETTLYASNARGDIIWSTTIRVGTNIGSIDQMLALAMPDAKIGVATMGTNTVLLTGTVATPEDASEAQNLVEAFLGGGSNVISRLKMATPLQVNLKVRFAEVSRNFVRAMGSNLVTSDTTGGFRFGISQGRGAVAQFVPSTTIPVLDPVTGLPVLDPTTGLPVTTRTPSSPVAVGQNFEGAGFNIVDTLSTGSTIAGFGRFLGLDIGSALDVAERQGLSTTLSQPNLTALSGETAEFLAGGEFPIPLSQGLGNTSVEYRNFGVSLSYTPTVLANGRISLRVRPEVSELSSQGAVTLNGFQIPALTIRRAETTIELGSGQSFMIAGLMSNSAQSTLDKTPGAGDLPILGNLFRSTEFRRGETELVIVVTPYLVKPVNDRDIVLPTDGFHAPNDAQRLLLNRESSNGQTQRPLPSAKDAEPATPSVSQSTPATSPRRKERTAEAAAPGFSFN